MPSSYTTSQNNELFSEGSQSLKSLVICDSRFESQIAIAVKSRDLEHLVLESACFTPPESSGKKLETSQGITHEICNFGVS